MIIAQIIEATKELTIACMNAINTSLHNLAQKDVDVYNELKAVDDATTARVDNIVSYSGSSNQEIVDARVDSDGYTYPTLKSRIDGIDASLNLPILKVTIPAAIGDTSIYDNTPTLIDFTYVYDDNFDMFDSGIITCKKSGLYRVTASVLWDTSNGVGARELFIYKNNSQNIVAMDTRAGVSKTMGQTITASIRFVINDKILLAATQDSSQTIDIISGYIYSPTLCIEFISD
jgi:hypothetical protein